MSLHLIKLCVGVDTAEELQAYVAARLADARARGEVAEQGHVTRVTPTRAAEILEGGSLYWVIRGHVQVRQRILRFDPVEGADGISRCRIVLEPLFNPTHWQPRRPFQGWRYLKAEDTPRDLGEESDGVGELPAELRRELAMLGLM